MICTRKKHELEHYKYQNIYIIPPLTKQLKDIILTFVLQLIIFKHAISLSKIPVFVQKLDLNVNMKNAIVVVLVVI